MKARCIRFLCLWSLLLFCSFSWGQVHPDDKNYAIGVDCGYAYNRTYGSQGVGDVYGHLPLLSALSIDAKARVQTANVYAVGMRICPTYELTRQNQRLTGSLYGDVRILYTAYARNHLHEFSACLLGGYKMAYVSLEVGASYRHTFLPTPTSVAAGRYGLVYQVEAFARPPKERWNISLGVSNVSLTQVESPAQPVFTMRGWYDCTHAICVGIVARCKPTGIFLQHATFYGAEVEAVMTYRLQKNPLKLHNNEPCDTNN